MIVNLNCILKITSHVSFLVDVFFRQTMLQFSNPFLNVGDDVVLLKNGQRICGSGAALSTAPIVQNKAYFQVNIQQTGVLFL